MTDNAPETSVTETVQEPVADTANPEIQVDAPATTQVDADTGQDRQPRRYAHEAKTRRLQEIAKQRQEERNASNPPEFHGDFRDPTQSMGNLAAPPPEPSPQGEQQQTSTEARESGPSDSQAPAPTDAPKKRILKVRQGEKEFTEEEIIALAQKAAAGDSYLDDARRLYDAARQMQGRSAPGHAPHQGQSRAQEAELPRDPSQGDPRQDDALAKVLEEVQFGADPKESAQKLRTALRRELAPTVAQTSQRALLNQRMTDDLSDTLSAFSKVKKANQDLFSEPYAEAVMERMLHEGWRQDLRSIGVPDERIPLNPNELQRWHRFYRVKGHRVRNSETLFNDVISGYRQFRGQSRPSQQQQPQNPNPARPAVSVNRTERRASIPQQPARSAAPPSVPSAAQPRKSYDQARAEMREARKRGVPFRRAS